MTSWLCLALLALSPRRATAADYNASMREVRAMLAELVKADTENPPGNEARAVKIAAARLKDAGIPFEVTEFAPGRENLVARLKGSGAQAPLLLLAHSDVPGTAGQKWASDPHAMIEAGGYLVGRGVYDMLGMAAIELQVLVDLKRSGAPLERDVIWAFTGDEQSGGAGLQYLLKNKPESIRAGLALNEGAGPMLGEDGKIKLIEVQMGEKIYQDFELVARGPSGHSSVPLKDNAIYRLSAALVLLAGHEFPARLMPVTRAYLAARAALEPPELARAMRELSRASGEPPAAALKVVEENPTLSAALRTTCVATMIQGGTRVNTLPAEARCQVNCRILPDESVEDVRRELLKVLADPTIELKLASEPAQAGPSPVDGPGPDAIRKIAGRIWRGAALVPVLSRSATDSIFLRAAGIPAYGIHPVPISEDDARRAHGVDERISLKSLRQGVEFFHRLVLELAAKKKA